MRKIFTIPNILSFVRILLIPVFIILYFKEYYAASVIVVVASGLTDILDGIIARKFNMVSDLGKMLDPAADKLTQASVAVCLAVNVPLIIPMLVILVVKELCMSVGALTLLKKGARPIDAKWFGKMSTVILYTVMILIIVNLICDFMPDAVIAVLSGIATLSILFAVINYYLLFRKVRNEEIEDKK